MTDFSELDKPSLYKALAVHFIVIGLFFVSWDWFRDDHVVKMPAHVKAMVISKGDAADRPAPRSKPQEKPKPKPPEPKPQPKPNPAEPRPPPRPPP